VPRYRDDEVAVVDQESDAAAFRRVLAPYPRVIAVRMPATPLSPPASTGGSADARAVPAAAES
jgi:hypothetical protein